MHYTLDLQPMLSYGDAFYQLKNALQSLYDTQEAAAIAHELLYSITGLEKMDRLMKKDELLTNGQQQAYNNGKAELLIGRPLQYVTGVAWFMGRRFRVNEQVLIPRPETEELVDWIVKDFKEKADITILDIGTGSGCIPISLQLALPSSTVLSCDISEGAINMAKENTRAIGADVSFIKTDFLNQKMWYNFDKYDVIVSNPPYIPQKEYENMHTNVRDHEPALALFVPSDDALLFYRNIAEFANEHLNDGGTIYCELHKDHAMETEKMFKGYGYKTELRKDMHGNDRMIKLNRDQAD
ncbi:MAG: peptide chain release factor N(5)-glutamine methyltransferase [Flavipsychrobacter sp.]|nr:peptide chain release factor N(5)-glutamine methyltransferase [Flavipsychrobacter sp.]